jgi:hypothetical protein
MDIAANIQTYLDGYRKNKGRNPDARYSSFDYCFNYFQSFKENDCVEKLSSQDNIQLTCLQLGFYLSSWGMFRGSSFLLEKSVRFFIPLIEAIGGLDKQIWRIDVHNYSEDAIHLIIECRNMIIQSLGIYNNPTDTLITKIMLGIFGNVPALDDNFCKGFNLRKVLDKRNLVTIVKYYYDNKDAIDNYEIYTVDFISGNQTKRNYTRAKLIDMIGFIEGLNIRAKN